MKLTQLFYFLLFGLSGQEVLAIFCPRGVPGCRRHLPPAVKRTPAPVLLTTPSLADDKSWNVSHPSDVANNCINAMGQSIEDFCTNRANTDWDPAKLNTSTTTDLENCCSLFDEMDCYVQNSATFCPNSTREMVIAYSNRLALYITNTMCPKIEFSGWKGACDKAALLANSNKTIAPNDNSTRPEYDFIHLPAPSTAEAKACFAKLRSSTAKSANQTQVNLEEKCHHQALAKWDPHRKSIVSNKAYCCAIYSTLDCLTEHSKTVCSSSEQKEMVNFQKEAARSPRCTTSLPYGRHSEHICASKPSAAFSHLSSSLFTAVLLLATVLLQRIIISS